MTARARPPFVVATCEEYGFHIAPFVEEVGVASDADTLAGGGARGVEPLHARDVVGFVPGDDEPFTSGIVADVPTDAGGRHDARLMERMIAACIRRNNGTAGKALESRKGGDDEVAHLDAAGETPLLMFFGVENEGALPAQRRRKHEEVRSNV